MARTDPARAERAVQWEDIGESCALHPQGGALGGLQDDGHLQRQRLQELMSPVAEETVHTLRVCTVPESPKQTPSRATSVPRA